MGRICQPVHMCCKLAMCIQDDGSMLERVEGPCGIARLITVSDYKRCSSHWGSGSTP